MRIQNQRSAAFLLLGMLAVVLAATRAADPAAVMIQLSGTVQVERAGRTLAAAVGTALEPGDRVIVPTGGRAVLMYRTGRIETATASTTIAARESEQVGGMYSQTMQTIVQVATTDAASQPNRQGMIRPIPGEPVPVSPRNGVRVLDVRPSFTWFSVPGANSYMVQVRRTDAPGPPQRFAAGSDTTWSWPVTAPPLVPGARYQWTVAAGTSGRPAQEVAFEVISAEQFGAIERMFAGLAEAGIDPDSDGLFVSALWYRDAGLFYEADRALARLEGTDAGAGRTFHLLRGEVFDRLGLLEAASRAFRAADAEPIR